MRMSSDPFIIYLFVSFSVTSTCRKWVNIYITSRSKVAFCNSVNCNGFRLLDSLHISLYLFRVNYKCMYMYRRMGDIHSFIDVIHVSSLALFFTSNLPSFHVINYQSSHVEFECILCIPVIQSWVRFPGQTSRDLGELSSFLFFSFRTLHPEIPPILSPPATPYLHPHPRPAPIRTLAPRSCTVWYVLEASKSRKVTTSKTHITTQQQYRKKLNASANAVEGGVTLVISNSQF